MASSDTEGWGPLTPYEIVDTPPEEEYDDIVGFAASLCEAPIALVSLVGAKRQWFKAKTGLDAGETPRAYSFCAHAMRSDGLMVVPDATRDPRFADNPLVTGDPHIRFYAGAPLVSPEGEPLGSLCVVDRAPRDGLAPLQAEGLRVLSRQVMALMEQRRIARARRIADAAAARELAESEERFRTLADTMPQMVWSARPDGHHDYFNARWYEYTGLAPGSTDGEGWTEAFHTDDRERAQALWRRSLETGAPYEIEYRLRHHGGEYRWTLGRALPMRDADGRTIRWFGTCTDIHEQKLMIEQREVIAQELSHRIKNIFSVLTGLMGLTARTRPETAEAIAELRDRVMALGRAHDFVRPHGEADRAGTRPSRLHGLLAQIFAPYRDPDGRPRVIVTGDDPDIDDRAATPLALAFHELATNAVKHGALSGADGRVRLAIAGDGESCRMDWIEEGGPAPAESRTPGFGTRLLRLGIERQLGGTLGFDWAPGGLQARAIIPRSALTRSGRAAGGA